MSNVIEATRTGLDRGPLSIGATPILGTICLATVAGVTSTLAAATESARHTVLPMLLIGAEVAFGSGLADVARGRGVRFTGAL